MNAQGEFFGPAVAPFLGQGDLFNPTLSVMSRVIQARGLVVEGVMSSIEATDEITRIGGPILQMPKAHVDDLLSGPNWPLLLVLVWMLHDGDAERVPEAYEDARRWRLPVDAHPGLRDAYRTLWSELERGTLTATARRRQGSTAPIPAEEWERLRPVWSGSVIVLSRDGQFHRDVYTHVQFDAAAVKAKLCQPASRARANSKATIKKENEVLRALVGIMSADRQHPIPKRRVGERSEFVGVPRRMFDRAWSTAVTAANAPAWSAAGRRKAS